MGETTKYFVVKQKAIPEVLLKVVEAKRLLESEKVLTIQEAVDAVGISRSSFYKYKDDIFPSEEWIQKAEQLGEEQQKQQEKERKREWKARLPEDFEDLSLVEILAKTQFQKTYMDVIVKAVEAEIPEKIVKSYIWDAMDEEEIECQIKIQRILQVSDQS